MSSSQNEESLKYIKKYYPDLDDSILHQLVEECRDPEDILSRLQSNDSSIQWKKSGPKNKSKNPNSNSQNRPRSNKNKPNKPTNPDNTKKPKEQNPPLLQKKKLPEFGKSSGATWGDINIESLTNPNPKPETKPQPKEQQKTKEIQPPETPVTPPPTQPEVESANTPKEIPQPQPEEVKPPEVKVIPQPALYLPTFLSTTQPNLSKFGTFSGPLPQEPKPRVPEMVRVKPQLLFEFPPKPKVVLSKTYSSFEIKLPPPPPPQPKVQPPEIKSVETQVTAQKEEQPQQDIPIGPMQHVPQVAAVASQPVGPLPQQYVANFPYPYPPFPYPYDINTIAAQQPQQLAFVQYPNNVPGYAFPYSIPPGYQMPPVMPQGVQQQQAQQQPSGQRPIPGKYNGKQQYSEDPRYQNNYNNQSNNRPYQQKRPYTGQ